MALFRKKEEEGYEEDEIEEKPLRKKLKAKDFKDLKPENRKKRKEPKKPWGKKERFFVLFVLLVTVGLSGFLALSSRSWKLPGLPRLNFKLSNFVLPFMGEETIIIEGRKKDKKASEGIITEFKRMTKDVSGIYGLYIIDLTSGYAYGVNENEEFEPASLNKLPVILGLYMESEAGNLNLNEKYTLRSSDKITGSGSLYSKPAGTLLTYRDLIRYMGKESDNTAFNVTRRFLGKEKIESVIEAIGMESTFITGDKQRTTPKDIGIFFQRLWWGGLISDVSKNELLGFLTDTFYENHLAAGIPSEVQIAHKYGRELHVVNDGGIVFAKNPYIAVIMSKGIVEKEADDLFPLLSQIIYQGEAVSD